MNSKDAVITSSGPTPNNRDRGISTAVHVESWICHCGVSSIKLKHTLSFIRNIIDLQTHCAQQYQ